MASLERVLRSTGAAFRHLRPLERDGNGHVIDDDSMPRLDAAASEDTSAVAMPPSGSSAATNDITTHSREQFGLEGRSSGGSIPVPMSSIPAFHYTDRRDLFNTRSSSSSDDEQDDETGGFGAPQSTSYFRPRTLDGYTRYLETVFMEGYLEKQSSEDPNRWKGRWFVMQESHLFYYKSAADVRERKPTDETCCGVISLENIDSVTTAKDFGVAAFQIRMESRRYVLRAESKDRAEYRPHRISNSLSRRQSMPRINRSVSFDCQDYGDQLGTFVMDDFYRGRGSMGNFVAPDSFADESSGEHSSRTSSRRSSSPLSYTSYGARSPLGVTMFAFDPLDDLPEASIRGDWQVENKDENDEAVDQDGDINGESSGERPALLQTLSPPVSSGKYIPRFLRNKSAATATSPPPSSPPHDVAPPPAVGRWVPRHQREGFTGRQSIEPFCMTTTRESIADAFCFEDNSSYSTGDEVHGVTSLMGVRSSMEDVCCCIPDLNAYIGGEDSMQKQSIYALFDGHSGVRAATFSNQRLISYLCSHKSFMTDATEAFEDCFRRIDAEFLEKAAAESLSDGTTAAVVLIRGNRLLTANIGDSRAVASIGGEALDIIEEQTPGRADERERIEAQGGWVKEERELHMSKLHSMDLSDPEIQQRAGRVVQWVNIYRVNGELAVSRAIGDIDYKGEALSKYEYWAYPEGHDKQFHGDLVISTPEFQEIEITPEFEFLILACDGLWDTITSKEAVKHVATRLKEGYTAQQASHSLANFAIRSGSSDNVSVVIVLLH